MLEQKEVDIGRITHDQFDKLVERVLKKLPVEFRRHLRNIAIIIEDRPSDDSPYGNNERLYGLYEGVPLPDRGVDEPMFPSKITIFRDALLEDYGHDAASIMEQVRITVLHEIGHHFGMDEDDLDEIDY